MERQIEKGEKDWKKAATSGIAAPACNPRKLKMPAVLKGWVAFQSRQGGTKGGGGGGVELTLDSRTDLSGRRRRRRRSIYRNSIKGISRVALRSSKFTSSGGAATLPRGQG